MKRTVVYILSTNRAGSHFLSLLLGSHSRAMHIGEVQRFRKIAPGESGGVCYLCRDKQPCPVLDGLHRDNVDQVYDLIFSRLPADITTLVDNSKIIRGWADRFLGDTRHERRYIHLIRDPRAIVRVGLLNTRDKSLRERLGIRLNVARSEPSLAPAVLTARETDVYLYRWLIRNRHITRFLTRHRLPACLVTYEDLARNTAGELERIMPWLGLAFEPSQVEYWNFEHHGTQKADYEWVKEKKTRLVDMRWKTFLPPETQQRIAANPAVLQYCRQIGVELGDDGLRRRGGPCPPYE